MNAFLMYKNRHFDLSSPLPLNCEELIQDLELNTLFNAMSLGDSTIFNSVKHAILSGAPDIDTILYRQEILKDCISNPAAVKDIYQISKEIMSDKRRRDIEFYGKHSGAVLQRTTIVLQILLDKLLELRAIAAKNTGLFKSEGFSALLDMLISELNDENANELKRHLSALEFPGGVFISAELGPGNKGVNYTLRKQNQKPSGLKGLFGKKPVEYTMVINEHSDLANRGINSIINPVAQSTDNIIGFFKALYTELGFFIGCLNLHDQLIALEEPFVFPTPAPAGDSLLSCNGIYDICLALTKKQRVIGNDLTGDKKSLFIITGANQGGKSTFIRGIGISQLMLQCGMFVPAAAYTSSLCSGVFTHFRREEDADMNSGRLDEELCRMNDIVNQIKPGALLIFNESFASTNETEGSEIARQIICALLEKNIRIIFVTHMYELAHGFFTNEHENTLHLRAERYDDGKRSFKIIVGEPLQTSYGDDLYKEIFEAYNANN